MKHKELPKEDEDEEENSITKEDPKSKKDTKEKKKKKLFKKAAAEPEKDPAVKFAGTGVTYKAKLFGHEEVPEARGEIVCQDAFSKLKLQLKTSGEHKQRILLNISMDGIKIRDEKSGELMHHHPVREISFISQDLTDSRAFGYIYGCKESGWRVFAIRTEKNASQVIMCIRELFEVVLLKKREIIEGVKKEAQMSENGSHHHHQEVMMATTNGQTSEKEQKQEEPAVANLLDLQSEMDSLEMGISHMDTSMRAAAANSHLLHEMTTEPPFDPFRLQNNPMAELPSPFNQTDPNWDPTTPEEVETTQPPDKYAVFANIDSVVSIFDRINQQSQEEEDIKAEEPVEVPSIFADLDPLSFNKPFVNKKDFFTDIKNPPKKVLKDLVDNQGTNSPYETVYIQEDISTPPPLLPPKKGGVNSRSQYKEDWEIPSQRNPFQNPFASPEMAPPLAPARPWTNGIETTPPIPTPLRKTSSPPTFIPNGVGSPLKRPPLAPRSPLSFEEEWAQSQSIRVPPPPPMSGCSPVHRGSIGGGASIVRPRPVGRLSASYVSSVSSTESVESLSGSPQSAGRHNLRDLEDSASLSGGSDISSNGGLPPSSDNSIFIKHSDPFADDPFFSSLSKKVAKPLQPC